LPRRVRRAWGLIPPSMRMRGAALLLLAAAVPAAPHPPVGAAGGLNLTVAMGDTRSCFADGSGSEQGYLAYTTAVNLDWATSHGYSFAFMALPCLGNATQNGQCAACLHPQHGARHPSWCKLLAVWFALDALRSDLVIRNCLETETYRLLLT
jgi:hypothetical protein